MGRKKIDDVGLSVVGKVLQGTVYFNGFQVGSADGFSEEESRKNYRFEARVADYGYTETNPNGLPTGKEEVVGGYTRYHEQFLSVGGTIRVNQLRDVSGFHKLDRYLERSYDDCAGVETFYVWRHQVKDVAYILNTAGGIIVDGTDTIFEQHIRAQYSTSGCEIVVEEIPPKILVGTDTGTLGVNRKLRSPWSDISKVSSSSYNVVLRNAPDPADPVQPYGTYNVSFSELIDYNYALSLRVDSVALLLVEEKIGTGGLGSDPAGLDDEWVSGRDYGLCGGLNVGGDHRLMSEYSVRYDADFSSRDVAVEGVDVRDMREMMVVLSLDVEHGVPDFIWLRGELVFISQGVGAEPVITFFNEKLAYVDGQDGEYEYSVPLAWGVAMSAPASGGAWYLGKMAYQIRAGGLLYEV